jgi:hypothetical protein
MTLLINGLGDNHFDEALEFIESQKLYLEALKVWKDDEAKLKVRSSLNTPSILVP